MRTAAIAIMLAFGWTAAAAGRPLHAMDTCTKVHYPASDIHSPDEQIDLLRKLGYAGIAWTAEDPAVVARVAAAGAQRAVPMSAIYLSATLTREGLRVDPRFEAIAAALKGHGTLLWLHITSQDFAPSDAAGDPLAVPELKRLANLAAGHGLRVALYPHARDWTERTTDAIRLANAVDHPAFGVSFNLCHALMAGEEDRIPALLADAGPRLFSVTLNGADTAAAGTSWQRLIQPLGRGTYDLGGLLRHLDKLRYQGPVFQQGYGIGMPPEDLLASSMHAWCTSSVAKKWNALPFVGGWETWQNQPGAWREAGGVAPDPANPKRLSPLPGQGVAVNGPDGREPDLFSAQAFADCELHLEFLVAPRSNSGVYLMGRYEVQIYDSFGVQKDEYPGLECGGIYPEWIDHTNQRGHSPLVNASLPAGQWQSVDITFRAPRFDAQGRKTAPARFVKVLHNGVTVHQDVDVPGPTRAGLEGEVPAAPFRLQGDHGPVAFRHVRIRTLEADP